MADEPDSLTLAFLRRLDSKLDRVLEARQDYMRPARGGVANWIAYTSIGLASAMVCLPARAQFYPSLASRPQPYVMQPVQPMQPDGPTEMNSQRFGNQTYYNGQVGGSQVTGSSQTLGNQTYSQFQGADGSMQNCTTQTIGNQIYTHCN